MPENKDGPPKEFDRLPEDEGKGDANLPPMRPLSEKLADAVGMLLAAVAMGIQITVFPRTNALLRGLRDLVIVTGIPGVGKSTWVHQIALDAASRGLPVIYYSLEMPEDELIRRSLLMYSSKVGNWEALRRHDGALAAAQAAVEARTKSFYLRDNSVRVDMAKIEKEILYVRARHNGVAPLVVIDHARLVDGGTAYNDALMRQEDMLAEMMSVMHRTGATILLVHELNKEGFGGMSMKGVKGSVSAVYNAATLIGLVNPDADEDVESMPEYQGDPNKPEPAQKKTIRMIVRKNRYGPENYFVPFSFDPALSRFTESPLPRKAL